MSTYLCPLLQNKVKGPSDLKFGWVRSKMKLKCISEGNHLNCCAFLIHFGTFSTLKSLQSLNMEPGLYFYCSWLLKYVSYEDIMKIEAVFTEFIYLHDLPVKGAWWSIIVEIITWWRTWWSNWAIYLSGILRRFQHCTGHITTGSWKGRGNQYIEFIRFLYCKLPTNGKQLPAFPLEAVPGIEPLPQRWEARVLPLCHRGPSNWAI